MKQTDDTEEYYVPDMKDPWSNFKFTAFKKSDTPQTLNNLNETDSEKADGEKIESSVDLLQSGQDE